MTSPVLDQVRMTSLWFIARLPRRVAKRMPLHESRGATAVEYGLILVLIAATVIVLAAYLGDETKESLRCTGRSISKSRDRC